MTTSSPVCGTWFPDQFAAVCHCPLPVSQVRVVASTSDGTQHGAATISAITNRLWDFRIIIVSLPPNEMPIVVLPSPITSSAGDDEAPEEPSAARNPVPG